MTDFKWDKKTYCRLFRQAKKDFDQKRVPGYISSRATEMYGNIEKANVYEALYIAAVEHNSSELRHNKVSIGDIEALTERVYSSILIRKTKRCK